MNAMHLGYQENISLPLIFVDGLTRSGKSAFSGIIPSLSNMEHTQFCTELELIVPAASLGVIDQQFARAFLRIYFNELSYNLQLSRNVNFRPGDQTGVVNNPDPQLYYDRLKRPEGDDAVDECRRGARSVPIITHDLMVNMHVVDNMDLNFKMLSLWRHPIDNIYSWWTRGWGSRFNSDPRGFTLLLDGGAELYPWYAAGFAAQLHDLNPMEKCVRIATDLLDRAVEQYRGMRSRDRIHVLTFESLCVQPDGELERICRFLGTEPTIHTPHALAAARFPRPVADADRDRKRQEFRTGIRVELYDRLMDNAQRYENNVYGLLE